jgi:tetratricopeptide (TPR) repeat protein
MLDFNPEESLLQSAIEAIRQGDLVRAREFLTRLLKDNQSSAEYWVWMSAAVETQKERLYCLQTALKLDPNSAAAKRGLVLMGGLPPDETIPPFPLKNIRSWENDLKIAGEEEKPRGFKALIGNPVVRLAGILVITVLLLGGAFVGFNLARPLFMRSIRPINPYLTYTPSLSPVPSPTPKFRTPTPTFTGPTPLWMLLPATYTPTPLYVQTPAEPASSDAFKGALRYFQKQDYQNAIPLLEQVLQLNPKAIYAYYYIGESYLLMGDKRQALDAFRSGIEADFSFAPNFLGRALTLKAINSKADILSDLDRAIQIDPKMLEAYLARADFYLNRDIPNYQAAYLDAETASTLSPSPFAYIYMAQALLGMGRDSEALENARKANELDLTNLDGYLVLAQAMIANDDYESALGPLNTVALYDPQNNTVNALLAEINYQQGNYDKVIDFATKAIQRNRQDGKAYLIRGKAYLAREEYQQAYEDLKLAQAYSPFTPEPNILRGVALLKIGQPVEAFKWFNNVEDRMQTDEQKAQWLFWRAMSLRELGVPEAAARDFLKVLEFPEGVVAPEMRAEALKNYLEIYTPTPGPTETFTPTPTETPTSTLTPTPSPTLKATATPKPSATVKPTATAGQ